MFFTQVALYKKFRNELDNMVIPEILKNKNVKTTNIVHNGKIVGIFCVEKDYIDCLYIREEYRNRGIAENFVRDWYSKSDKKEFTLHIIDKNLPALSFWNKNFYLEVLEVDSLTTYYKIVGMKEI